MAGIAEGDYHSANFQLGGGSPTLEGEESSVAASTCTRAIIVPDSVVTGLSLF